MILQIWRRVFTNEGHGTRHDVGVRGFSALGDLHRTQPLPEKMQLDAGLAAVAALYEMLLYHQRGVHYLFAGVPAHWEDVSFAGMRTDGAFLVSAERREGTVRRVEIDSPAGGRFSLRNPWDDAPVQITRSGAPAGELTGDVLVIETTPGERVTVQPAG
jgi:alpha-L-fucosidase 2